MKIIYYIKRIWQIPLIEKKLLVKGMLLCIVFLPIVNLLSLKNYIWLLKNNPKSPATVYDKKYFIRLARKTMRRIERFSPLKFSCLVKSMTFKMLLNTLGVDSNIALGINNTGSYLLRAHAFVKVDNEVVYLKRRRFIEVYLMK